MIINTACAGGKHRVRLDTNTRSTVLDGDATGIIEGCGNQPIVGFTYCRQQEGDNAGTSLSFVGPPAKCDEKIHPDGCVFIKVWDNQSNLVGGGMIPKKETRLNIPWSKLLSSPHFQLGSRGFWTWNVQVYFLDPDGREQVSNAQGDIILRVYRKGYLPLHQVEDDPNFVWEWLDGDFLYKMTSGLRAFVKRVK